MNKSATSNSLNMNTELESLTDYEMDCITRVFRSFETGLRQATILPKVNIATKLFVKLMIKLLK